MTYQTLVNSALCLPAPEVEALIHGRMIVAMPPKFIRPGQVLALLPFNLSTDSILIEQYYNSKFLNIAQASLRQLANETLAIKAWAKCEFCQMLDDAESLEKLSRLTIWTTEALQQILLKRPYIFLAYLRVYLLPDAIEMPLNKQERQFVALPNSLAVTESYPVLTERTFSQRRQQLEKLEPPQHPELEELQNAIALLAETNPAAKQLAQDIKIFLGWSSNKIIRQPDPDLAWIKTITDVGNSSDGNAFEKLVRKSFIKLGFTNSNLNPKASLDPNSTGGAGGIDVYCETPYPVVGECKASKHENVPNSVTAQLIHLGVTHLGQEQFNRSIKLIFAAGALTDPANKAAIENKMNVIRPETLQKLVQLKADYEGSINLLELKECWQQEPFGVVDDKVNAYINRVQDKIKLRSHLIKVVKNYLQNTGLEDVGVEALHGAYFGSHPPQPLTTKEMHDIVIELSSPLTGYLGRIREDGKSDRFYFLRDLPITHS